jgi:hypothetical protein
VFALNKVSIKLKIDFYDLFKLNLILKASFLSLAIQNFHYLVHQIWSAWVTCANVSSFKKRISIFWFVLNLYSLVSFSHQNHAVGLGFVEKKKSKNSGRSELWSLGSASTAIFRVRLFDKRSTFLTKPTAWAWVCRKIFKTSGRYGQNLGSASHQRPERSQVPKCFTPVKHIK